ncbi:MAG: hypothetical protein LBD48_01705 [Treponema sp.]|nr:hypothetical protein [Treponema sp.]
MGVVLLAALTGFAARPRMLWYVDEEYAAAWTRILQQHPSPIPRYEVRVRPAGGGMDFPKYRFGYIITRKGPEGERGGDAPVRQYRNLSQSREYDGWLALALDPWMVFRKHQDPEPRRTFLEMRNDRGTLLLAGSDPAAAGAWLCQLLQESPGVFVQDREQWDEAGRSLERNYPFQSGAFTYSWVQVWPVLLREKTAWLYAPLSQARTLAPYRMGLLDATRFPDPAGWNEYGMQADILWAGQRGSVRQRKKIDAVDNWLRSPETQTIIANTIDWIPAHPSGTPYNTISWETQMAWLRSSFIWQGADDAQDS